MKPTSLIHAWLLAAAAAAALSAAGCRRGPTAAGDAADPTASAPVPVRTCLVELATLRPTLDLVGTIAAIPECSASVSPQVGGWVQEVLVTEGDTVQAGQELVRLDPRLAQVNLEKAQASLLEKEALLARARHGYLPQEIDVARAEADRAEADANALRGQFDAAKSLHEKHEMSDVQFNKLASGLQAAEASRAAAAAKLKLLEAGTRSEDIAQAEAQAATARAGLKDAELALQFCTIPSPLTGRVTRLFTRQGMFSDRAVILATVTDLSDVFAKVRIPNAFQAKVPAQADAVIRLTALPGQTFQGKLARISGRADSTTGDMDAFVRVANGEGLLQPGFACQVHLSLGEIAGALVVPVRAVADRDGVPVLTVVREGKAYEIEVTLGEKTGDLVQISHGLKAGDVVATEGGYGLPAGCPVEIRPQTGPADSPPESPAARP